MPRHLISDAHEWSNEIPTVQACMTAKQQPGERAWDVQRGKKTLLSLTLARRRHRHGRRSEVGDCARPLAPGAGALLGDHWAWWGVWLGRHARRSGTRASKDRLRGAGNHPRSTRAKACLRLQRWAAASGNAGLEIPGQEDGCP